MGDGWFEKIVKEVFDFTSWSELLILRLLVFLIFLYGACAVAERIFKGSP